MNLYTKQSSTPAVAPSPVSVEPEKKVAIKQDALLAPQAPQTIGELVDNAQQSYAEKAKSINKGSYLEMAETYENIFNKPAPFNTQESFLSWKAGLNQSDLEFLEKQQDYSRQIEQIQFDKAKQQIAGAEASVAESMARGREGVMSSTAPMFTSEFRDQMKQQVNQLEIEKASLESQRQKQMLDLKNAQESNDMDLAEAIQGRISQIEQNLKQADSEMLRVATVAEQQALETARFQHTASLDTQANYRANLSVFQDMVQMGTQMDVNQINSMATSLGVPFEVAYNYYTANQMVRDDKYMDFSSKQIALADLSRDFDLKVQGVIGEKAQIVHGIMNMVKEGRMTQEEASNYLMASNIDSSMNPLTQLQLQLDSADLLAKQIGLKYLDVEKQQLLTMGGQQITSNDLDLMIKGAKAQNAGEREILELEELKIQVRRVELEKNEYEQGFNKELDTQTAKDVFLLTGKSRVTASFGEGHKECGEAYNDLTEGSGRAGSSYSSKMNLVTKQDSPKVGNGLVLPLSAYYKDANGKKVHAGHIETVISVNNVTGQIQTVSYNRDGKGSQTIETYNIAELKKKYGDDWGFTGSTLKPEYQNKLNEVISPVGTQASGEVYSIAQKFILAGINEEKALSMAEDIVTKKIETSYNPQTKAGLETTIQVSNVVVRDFDRALDEIEKSWLYNADGAIGRNVRGVNMWSKGKMLEVQDLLDSASSNVGLDTLLRIKKEGASLGGVSEGELELLKSVFGRFDATRNREDLKKDIKDARDIYQRIIDGAKEDLADIEKYNAGNVENMIQSAQDKLFNENYSQLISDQTGYYVIPESLPQWQF